MADGNGRAKARQGMEHGMNLYLVNGDIDRLYEKDHEIARELRELRQEVHAGFEKMAAAGTISVRQLMVLGLTVVGMVVSGVIVAVVMARM